MKSKKKNIKMKIKENINQVHMTTNYEQFKFRKDNRNINQRRVNILSTNMKKNGWLRGSYLVVNEKIELIDGQHRLLGAMLAGVPVAYIIEPGSGFKEIRGLNQGHADWKYREHLDGYVKEKNPDYIVLNNFLKEFPQFRFTEALMFLVNNNTGVNRYTFDSGLFKVADVEKGKTWARQVSRLQPYFENGYNKSLFVRGIIRILAKKSKVFDMEEFIRKVSIRPGMIYSCGTTEQYINLIESIYNYYRKDDEKVNLRF